MPKHGEFSGSPKTEWEVNQQGPDRDMTLMEDFWYEDPNGKRWMAGAGSKVNGASIPRPLWSLVGSPFVDDYRRASIVHDVACGDSNISRKEADVMFYHACRAGGCGRTQGLILYAGVRIGAWAKSKYPSARFDDQELLFRKSGERGEEESQLISKFTQLSKDVTSLGEEASLEDVDQLLQKHLS